ncbi:MAG: ISKra4 family transposase [Methylocystis silviterrae]|uniref:ISKra4 family transposase n=1 Tax=Methylocystis silviterrae TaxID=2743612 RepID=UPI003C763E1F
MKWTVKLERIDEAGNFHSATVGHIERPELRSESDLGLTHDDGKFLIRRVQAEIAQDQVRALIPKIRPCPCCGRLRSIKEHRRRRIDTVFGHLRIHAPRFEACACGGSAAPSPMAVLFPYRSTPELRYLQTKLGCKFSYQQAADILNEFLPDLSCFNHATTRNRVLAIGKVIEAETRAEISEKPSVEKPVERMIVGIDGAFVKATRSKNQRRNFEIVLGRIEACGRQDKIFAAVRDLDGLARERVRSALRSAGRGPATDLTVLSDGEDAMRLMAGQWLNGRVEHRLDWFHLRRRIQWLGRSIYWAVNYDEPAFKERLARYRRNLRSVRWNVWHYGKSRHARWIIALSRLGAQLLSHRNEIDSAGGDVSKIEAAYKRFNELEGYLYSNIRSLTDYGRAWRQGERIATANIESTVNQLVNQRMCKKRQMRWSRLGAQLMLHVRTAHLNGILERYCGMPQPVEWTWPNDKAIRQAA